MMTPDEILEQLKQKFGDAIGETEVREVEVRLTTTSEHCAGGVPTAPRDGLRIPELPQWGGLGDASGGGL